MHYNYVVREELRRFIMGVPISIRLDDEVRAELEAQAQSRGSEIMLHWVKPGA